jgi:MoaA/NifB/PqqE/SkfB family radical SAM enzyme
MGLQITGSIVHRIYCRFMSIWAQRLSEIIYGTIRPSMIANFSVTSKCNFSCDSCNIGRNYRNNPDIVKTDLTKEEIISILDRDIEALKYVSWIQFTGGEPFLRNDIDQIVIAFKDKLPNCGFWLPTNGWQSKKIIELVSTMINGGVDRLGIGVSIHGNRNQHDKYSGQNQAYDRAIETLKLLIELKKKFKFLRVSASYTITPDNVNSLVRTFDMAKALGADFTCRIPNSSDFYYQYTNSEPYSSKFLESLESQILLLEGRMGFQKAIVNPLKFPRWRYYRGIIEYARNPKKVQLPCRAGKTSVFITSKGIVHPCLFIKNQMGDLHEKSLFNILNSPENRKLQKKIQAGDCPNCWVECEIYRVLNENLFQVVVFGIRETMKNWIN